MFDFVAKYKKRILIGLLVLIIPPFALFGIDSYFRDSPRGQVVATVGDYQITEHEFLEAVRQRQEMLRNLSGGRVDPAMLDSAELRSAVLENLIRQRVLLAHAVRSNVAVTADQVRALISQAPVFQDNGQFSLENYQAFLKQQGQSAVQFENTVRQEIMVRLLADAYAGSSFAPRSVAERLLRLTEQEREVSQVLITPDRFVDQVKLEEGAAKQYYEGNQAEFRIPEQVRVEYVALSAENVIKQAKIDPAEVKKFYEANARQFAVPETRQASHILLAVEKDAPEQAKAQARTLAAGLRAELAKTPARFAELAKKHSQDPGSAARGGELGAFTRGTMVKAFDDAVFALKPGEISPVVETEYGYHIIRVTEVTPGQSRSLEQARPEIEAELRKQSATRLFAEIAEKLNNTVFEQSDSLKPAAELVGQAPQQSGWITRSGGAQDPRLNDPKLLGAVFSEDVLVNRRNTEAVEVAPGTIVAARVIEHKPSVVQPFEQVREQIRKKLIGTRAASLAAEEGKRLMAALRAGESPQVNWTAPQIVSRTDPKGLPELLVRQAFRAGADKLPAYTGVESPNGQGYMLLRVSRVFDAQKIDRAQQKSLGEGLAQLLGEEQFGAFVTHLRNDAKVQINKEALERK